MTSLGDMLEIVRPWVSTGALLALCEFARRLWVQNRQLRLAENKDDREGYGALIDKLNGSILSMETRHAADIAAMRADYQRRIDDMLVAHRGCEERLAKIEGELLGFHRQALIQSQQGLAQLPASIAVQEAGERAVAAIDRTIEQKEGGER